MPAVAEPVTVADIDEALAHASRSARDDGWWDWVDALLDQRLRVAR